MPVAAARTRTTVARLADLVRRLGDIPLERILLHPIPGSATEKDVIECEAKTGCLCELVDGVLVEKAMGYYEDRLGVVLILFLEQFIGEDGPGFVLGTAGMMRTEEVQVRMPDVAFYLWKHFPKRLLPRGQILDRRPELAVEILSPKNTRKEMDRKRREYFAGGTKIVWQVYPKTRTVRVYTAVDRFTELGEDDTLDGGKVLPGFALPIKKWFQRASRKPRK
jgi:Uma2 family endonuclease